MKKEIIMHEKTGLSYHKITHESGLTILCWPMEGYQATHALFGTNYGSVDRAYTLNGVRHESPAGTAHFLEHKMFENEDGQDAFELYAATGAAANAFTSFERTCYIFTATSQVDLALDILLSFVTKPYFTAQTIEKEQGIIGQEIKMYDDKHSWRLLFALLNGMYFESYVKDDIAGSVQSIAEITPEELYACTDAFYNPYNMVLSVAGNTSLEQVIAAVERAEIAQVEKPEVERLIPAEPREVKTRHTSFEMPVSQPMLGVGFKIDPPAEGERMRAEIIAQMIGELITGDTTALHRGLYDEGLISSGLEGELLSGDGYFSIIFSGEVNDTEEVTARLLAEIERLKKDGVDQELFTACKNRFWGEEIFEMESVEDVATGMAGAHMRGHTFFEGADALAEITAGDVNAAIRAWFDTQRMVTAEILPQEAGE